MAECFLHFVHFFCPTSIPKGVLHVLNQWSFPCSSIIILYWSNHRCLIHPFQLVTPSIFLALPGLHTQLHLSISSPCPQQRAGGEWASLLPPLQLCHVAKTGGEQAAPQVVEQQLFCCCRLSHHHHRYIKLGRDHQLTKIMRRWKGNTKLQVCFGSIDLIFLLKYMLAFDHWWMRMLSLFSFQGCLLVLGTSAAWRHHRMVWTWRIGCTQEMRPMTSTFSGNQFANSFGNVLSCIRWHRSFSSEGSKRSSPSVPRMCSGRRRPESLQSGTRSSEQHWTGPPPSRKVDERPRWGSRECIQSVKALHEASTASSASRWWESWSQSGWEPTSAAASAMPASAALAAASWAALGTRWVALINSMDHEIWCKDPTVSGDSSSPSSGFDLGEILLARDELLRRVLPFGFRRKRRRRAAQELRRDGDLLPDMLPPSSFTWSAHEDTRSWVRTPTRIRSG